jgi:hypothetical protein
MHFKEFLLEEERLIQEGKINDFISYLKREWKWHDKFEKTIIIGLVASIVGIGGVLGVGLKLNYEEAKNLARIEDAIYKNVGSDTQESIQKKYEQHLKLKKEAQKVITTWVTEWDPVSKSVRARPHYHHDSKAVKAYKESVEYFADIYRINLKE